VSAPISPEGVAALTDRIEAARVKIDLAKILAVQLPDVEPRAIPIGVKQILNALDEARAALAIIEEE
jgi:hypothetical protein